MALKRFQNKKKRVPGSRRERQHSPPVIDKKALRAKKYSLEITGSKENDFNAGSKCKPGTNSSTNTTAVLEKAKPARRDGAIQIKQRKKVGKSMDDTKGGTTPRAFLHVLQRMGVPVPAQQAGDAVNGGANDNDTKKRTSSATESAESKKKTPMKQQTKAAAEAAAKLEREKQLRSLSIQPGESFAEFSRRVDTQLPVIRARSGVPSAAAVRQQRKREKAIANGQVFPSKSKGNDADVDADGSVDYSDDEAEERRYQELKSKRSRSPDPWKKLTRPPPPAFGEIAEAPPVLSAPTKKTINVPKASGTLAERMVLEAERERVINRYRGIVDKRQQDRFGDK
ncbi:uncharacterized protein V1518DRAFT_425325 [Limtongia smithiae]|uniref:uncharacterized protein n=1 Tax=Limtongia smithiae TaxID=1125753 RepID=UPI0034CEBA02